MEEALRGKLLGLLTRSVCLEVRAHAIKASLLVLKRCMGSDKSGLVQPRPLCGHLPHTCANLVTDGEKQFSEQKNLNTKDSIRIEPATSSNIFCLMGACSLQADECISLFALDRLVA